MKAVIRMGRRGRWRWILYDPEETVVALAPVRGYEKYLDAVAAVRKIVPGCAVENGGRREED